MEAEGYQVSPISPAHRFLVIPATVPLRLRPLGIRARRGSLFGLDGLGVGLGGSLFGLGGSLFGLGGSLFGLGTLSRLFLGDSFLGCLLGALPSRV